MLSEYERGRAQLAIEWVARAQKPIAEVGGRPIDGCDLTALVGALNECIHESGEDVRGFIIPDQTPGYCCYGFYRYEWALDALLSVWGPGSGPRHHEWLYGLLFGYDAEAIERFVTSSSSERESTKSPLTHDTSHRVGIYGIPESPARDHNSWSGKSLRPS